MIKIGVITANGTDHSYKLTELINRLVSQFGTAFEISTTGITPADGYIKKLTLEVGASYKEFNPRCTPYNLYSAMPVNYYGKNYHPTHFIENIRRMCWHVDRLILVGGVTQQKSLETSMNKMKKKVLVW